MVAAIAGGLFVTSRWAVSKLHLLWFVPIAVLACRHIAGLVWMGRVRRRVRQWEQETGWRE